MSNKSDRISTKSRGKLFCAEHCLLQAIDLRDNIFHFGDDSLIYIIDLLIINLAETANKDRNGTTKPENRQIAA